MYRSSRFAVCSTALLLAACMKKEAPKDTTAAMAPAAAPAAAPAPAFSLADVAGKWKVTTTPTAGKDTSSTIATLNATADTTGWALDLPGGQKVPMQVKVSGDSVMMKSAVYPSMRRKGKKVWTESAFRLDNGKITGTTVAHYANSGADSVLTLRTEGTKLP
ncbi:MAG: hypothetical protein JF589_14430 [Gemmatimonadetes bacterium]|jgi:hypothetical protein|nr:hypothetical protein [Gemmatimonadota bacterium]